MDKPFPSFFGRCHLYKMVSFSQLLYAMQTIPLLIKHKDFQILNIALVAFLWHQKKTKKTCITLTKLYLPRSEEGNYRSFRLYNLCCLVGLLPWLAPTNFTIHYQQSGICYGLAIWFCCNSTKHHVASFLPPTNLLIRDMVITSKESRK